MAQTSWQLCMSKIQSHHSHVHVMSIMYMQIDCFLSKLFSGEKTRVCLSLFISSSHYFTTHITFSCSASCAAVRKLCTRLRPWPIDDMPNTLEWWWFGPEKGYCIYIYLVIHIYIYMYYVLYHIILYYIILYYIILCYVMLYYIMLYYIILYYVIYYIIFYIILYYVYFVYIIIYIYIE